RRHTRSDRDWSSDVCSSDLSLAGGRGVVADELPGSAGAPDREEFMHKPVRKAVFPVAGLGTRFLPATKAMPKEMLPIVDKPLIRSEERRVGKECRSRGSLTQ